VLGWLLVLALQLEPALLLVQVLRLAQLGLDLPELGLRAQVWPERV
jgi:hypothetical protein